MEYEILYGNDYPIIFSYPMNIIYYMGYEIHYYYILPYGNDGIIIYPFFMR
jgi:hypothetical protein